MTPAEFQERLHACLDARIDPLDDAELCAHLAEHPDELDRFAALRQRLLALPALAAARPVRVRWPLVLATAAAATFAVLLTQPTQVSRDAAIAPGRVLAASLEELRPRAHAAVSFTVREVLAHTPDLTFETFQLRSERR